MSLDQYFLVMSLIIISIILEIRFLGISIIQKRRSDSKSLGSNATNWKNTIESFMKVLAYFIIIGIIPIGIFVVSSLFIHGYLGIVLFESRVVLFLTSLITALIGTILAVYYRRF